MTLKTTLAAKPANRSVLEKLGHDDTAGGGGPSAPSPDKKETASKQPTVSQSSDKAESSSKKDKKRDRDKKSAADRREELLKQLKAVENAIAKKRTRISTNN